MRIGQMAKAAELGIETIRFYERKGLIEQPLKPFEGYRDYSSQILDRLLFIKRAKKLGFTLEEISSLLSMESAQCDEIQEMASLKLEDVRSRLIDLARLETVLDQLVSSCQSKSKKSDCPIIYTLIQE